MDKKGIIELMGMEFHARHGCLEKERVEGNRFIVDFRGCTDVSRAAESDRLEDTADYGEIYDIVAREMGTPSKLMEHIAGRIVGAIAERFPEMEFSIRVSKMNPPVGGRTAYSRITLSRSLPEDGRDGGTEP